MNTEQNTRGDILDAKARLERWEANKHKYLSNVDWWRDFYLSPSHAESKEEAQELIEKAAGEIAAEDLAARKETGASLRRWEAIYKSPETRGARRADRLRLLSLNIGHLGVIFLLLYSALRLTGRGGLPALDMLWALGLFATPLCYVMAVVFTFRASSLWEKAQRCGPHKKVG